MAGACEQLARARKVTALVTAFDAVLLKSGANYGTHTAKAHYLAGCQSRENWARVAVLAGCRPPSAETVREVVAVYAARVMATGALAS